MRIVGVDCGTEKTGFGVIDSDGRTHKLVSAGVVRTKAAESLDHRLKRIAAELRRVLDAFSPDMMAVEEVFHAVNTKSALKLAHVRGVVLLLAAEAGIPIGEYSPLEVKMSVVGYGRAEKQQVQMMVRSLLGAVQEFETYDVTDALAVAICHGTRVNFPVAAGEAR